MPKAKYIEGTRVPASYLNFYIANKIVLVPIFKDKNEISFEDNEKLEIICRLKFIKQLQI